MQLGFGGLINGGARGRIRSQSL